MGALLLAGLLLRVLPARGLAVEHFDEGVYASSLYFGPDDDYRYPDRHLYAPPLFPKLVEYAIVFCGPFGYGPFLVSLFAGTATTLFVWYAGRAWFGPAAGLAAAALLAFSDVHMLYSRAVLTDVLMGCLLLGASLLLARGLARGDVAVTLFGGVVSGLCWLTKYNGWLPLVIALAGTVAWKLTTAPRGAESPSWRRTCALWLGAALVAFAVWSPALFDLADRGGYAAVAANHRQYVVGLSGWFDSAARQIDNLRRMQSWPTLVGFALAAVLPQLASSSWKNPAGRLVTLLLAATTLATALWLGAAATLAVLAIVGLLVSVRKTSTSPGAALGRWMAAAWFVGLFLATPFYRAYPRLTLPWLLAAILAAGAGLAWFHECLLAAADAKTKFRPAAVATTVVALAAAAVFLVVRPLPLVPAWQPRTAFARLAPDLINDMHAAARDDPRPQRADVPFVVYVFGEPGLFYHLAMRDVVAQPAGGLGMSHENIPAYLVTGPHAHRSGLYQRQMEDSKNRFQLLKTYRYTPSLLVQRNRLDATEEGQEVRLYVIGD